MRRTFSQKTKVNPLFINPPNDNEIIGNDIDVETECKGKFPPLGLMYLASACGGKMCDLQIDNLNGTRSNLVGITAMTHTLIDVKRTIDMAKNMGAKVIVGGPHATLYPKETLALGADYVVVGEGEEIINNLTLGINYGKPIENLDNLKFPLRKNIDKYWSITSDKPITTMMSSRGCPYQCEFCDRPAMGKKFRMRSPNNVVDEMEECFRMGIREIMFYDDTFTVNRERVIDICGEILKRKLKIKWDVRARVDTVDEALLSLMKKAGCVRIHFGVESGSQKVINTLNKGITVEEARLAFQNAQSCGMSTLAYFMIGCPEETKEDINETLKLAKELKPDFAKFNIFTPFPGTKIYERWLKRDNPDVWLKFAKTPQPFFKPPLWEESKREYLQEAQRKLYKNFYGRISYIARKMVNIRNVNQFKRYFNAGRKLLSK